MLLLTAALSLSDGVSRSGVRQAAAHCHHHNRHPTPPTLSLSIFSRLGIKPCPFLGSPCQRAGCLSIIAQTLRHRHPLPLVASRDLVSRSWRPHRMALIDPVRFANLRFSILESIHTPSHLSSVDPTERLGSAPVTGH